MDDQPTWTPGEPPAAPEPPSWSAPSAPGGPDYAGSSYGASGSSYPGSSYPPPAGSPYAPPASSPYAPPPASPYGPATTSGYGGSAQFGSAAPYGGSATPPAQPGQFGAPTQPAFGQPSFAGGYPPPDQAYGYAAPLGGPYAIPSGNESLAVASMWVGIAAFLAPVLGPIVAISLGAVALGRIKRTGQQGRGMARWGIGLGIFWLVMPIVAAIAIPVFLNQHNRALHTECAGGDMAACDTLFNRTSEGSAEHSFADTCGGRTDGGYLCTSVGAVSYGDSPTLDRLWDACAAGDAASCDELYNSAAPGSEYSDYGMTCGGRTDGRAECVDALGEQSST